VTVFSVLGPRITATSAVAAATLGLALLPAAGAARSASTSAGRSAYPQSTILTDTKIAHWAPVVSVVGAHAQPKASSSTVTTLNLVTSDGTQNIVLILGSLELSPTETWYHVLLPILPNNSTGWVPASALGNIYTVHTHLYVNRETQTATLKRDGATIFTTRVGVGRSYWPTPAGQFYIRDKLTNLNDPSYGPVAFGTSAR